MSPGGPVGDLDGSDDSRFRRLVNGIADYAIYLLDAEGRVCSWNQGAGSIKGYPKEEVLGRHVSMFYTDDAREAGRPSADLSQAARGGRYETEDWRVRKDGSAFWANIVLSALHDEQGNLQGYANVTKDMTERKRLDERFRQVVESAPNAMVMVNRRGGIEMVNVQAERMFGYERHEMLGQSVEILVPEGFRGGHPEKRAMFFRDPRARPMGAGRDLYGRRKDGTEFPVEIGLNPIETAEGVMVLSAIVDISDRKQKEQRIQAALQEKDLLLGEIHHRVKNNLQIVHSLLDLQSTRIADPVVLGMLMDSQNRVRSMALIHQTLYQSKDFAKVDFGNFLEALVPTLVASYGVDSGSVRLRVEVDEVYLPINAAIPCGLLVNELITNALKHAFPDGRSGEVVVCVAYAGQGQVRLEVSDDGVGISEDADFAQSETLGLSLVTLLSKQLEGRLTIKRARPTRFTLDFPAAGTGGGQE